jgi:uncharacterized protein (DUF3820 family)
MRNDKHVSTLDPQALLELAKARMPYGRYKNRRLYDLPEPYLVWYYQKGFPKGKLGIQLAAMFEIKVNGLEYLLKKIPEK